MRRLFNPFTGKLQKTASHLSDLTIPAFKADRDGGVGQVITSGSWQQVKTTREEYDTNGDYVHDIDDSGDVGESRFTASIAGKYRFVARARIASWSGNIAHQIILGLRLNGTAKALDFTRSSSTANRSVGMNVDYDLAVNDYVEFWFYQNSEANRTLDYQAEYLTFSGSLIT